MVFHSILAFSLFILSHAPSVRPKALGRSVGSPALAENDAANVLGPHTRLHIKNKVIAPDGFSRSASVVNDAFPGPLIRANKGDQFSVEVLNELTDETMPLQTSIHWHGLFQRGSNWADGPVGVTQCPLRQQETFVQKFNATDQTGTYFWHSHYSNQRCEGVYGPLVIYDSEDPSSYLYDVDDENTIIVLSDWYQSPEVLRDTTFGFPNSTLINGVGRYPGGPAVPLSVVTVKEGLRYRFRVISAACESTFNFTIDGHRMTIIEVDGIGVQPTEVDILPILPAQRYSVVITADQPIGNYWLRALSTLPGSTFEGGQNLAIFRYKGAQDEDPTSLPGPYEIPFDEGKLHPLLNPGAPGIPEIGKADVSLNLSPGFIPEELRFTFGNVSYMEPPVPVLLQILGGARQVSELFPHGSVYVLPRNKVVEISFSNPGGAPGGPHPIHLHGMVFDVVKVSGSNTTNFVDPVRRDVIAIGHGSDNVTIRFRTDNPGPWFIHCHIEFHMLRGFAAVLAVAPEDTAEEEAPVVPYDWKQLCKN